MKVSAVMLAAAVALLAAGIALDGLPGILLTTVANVLSATAMIRELRRKPEAPEEASEKPVDYSSDVE